MSEPILPPDLPPEYADAYRRGYERAYRQWSGEQPDQPESTGPEVPAPEADAIEDSPPFDSSRSRDSAPFDGTSGRQTALRQRRAHDERPRWLVPVLLLGGAVLVLLLGAYAIGRMLSSSMN